MNDSHEREVLLPGSSEPVTLYEDKRHPVLMGMAAVIVPFLTYLFAMWTVSPENPSKQLRESTLMDVGGRPAYFWLELIIIVVWALMLVRECISVYHFGLRSFLRGASFVVLLAVPVVLSLFLAISIGQSSILFGLIAFAAEFGTLVFLWRVLRKDFLRLVFFSAFTMTAVAGVAFIFIAELALFLGIIMLKLLLPSLLEALLKA